eukprot:GILI01057535.1.p1 GENE.GILI01057535.1~~GILI01057535.1.p1  ORF type:complete len:182 (-),score=9.26 GILI01057535.1:39-584(-)
MVDLVEDDNVDLRALSLRQSHPGAPVQALYEALKNLDEACAIAIALKPLCGPNRASNIAEGRMVGARGVDLNAKGGVTPLMLAVSFGSISVARRLLEAGASVDKADVEYMSTPLHLSVTVEMTSLLLSYNANPNAPDKVGYTPLHNAAAYGGSAMIPLLIEHGGHVTCLGWSASRRGEEGR